LKTALQKLRGRDAVKANLEYQLWSRQGDAKHPRETQGKITIWAEHNGQGLKLAWSRDLLEQADRESIARAKDPEKTTPTRRALSSLGPLDVAGYLDASEVLLRELETAEFQAERSETYNGQAARCLVLRVQPRLSAQEKKYVKDLQATAQVWLGADGVPMGARREVKVKGRAFLVIGFEQNEKEEFRFARVGDRLVTTLHQQERSGSGGGESGASKSTMSLALKN
jgi:hypothetical protein